MPVPPKPDPVKFCEFCGEQLCRKRFNGRLEDYQVFLRRRFCNLSCANSKTEVGKSAQHWRARKHRKGTCEDCGAMGDLHVHHKDRDPSNNDPANLVTLCDSCHLKLHWREDRDKRLAAVRRPPEICVVCEGEFWPRHRRIQTCSPACKAVLLSRSQPATSSGYRGVYWDSARSKWQARIKRNGRFLSVGRFETAEEAAAAIATFGEAS